MYVSSKLPSASKYEMRRVAVIVHSSANFTNCRLMSSSLITQDVKVDYRERGLPVRQHATVTEYVFVSVVNVSSVFNLSLGVGVALRSRSTIFISYSIRTVRKVTRLSKNRSTGSFASIVTVNSTCWSFDATPSDTLIGNRALDVTKSPFQMCCRHFRRRPHMSQPGGAV